MLCVYYDLMNDANLGISFRRHCLHWNRTNRIMYAYCRHTKSDCLKAYFTLKKSCVNLLFEPAMLSVIIQCGKLKTIHWSYMICYKIVGRFQWHRMLKLIEHKFTQTQVRARIWQTLQWTLLYYLENHKTIWTHLGIWQTEIM